MHKSEPDRFGFFAYNKTMRLSFASLIIGLFILIIGTHILALFFSWYWTFAGLDVLLHFAGGAWVALIFLWWVRRSPADTGFARSCVALAVMTLSFTAFAGVLWEFFEFMFDITIGTPLELPNAQLGLRDTLSDLVFDLLGAGFVLSILKLQRHAIHN